MKALISPQQDNLVVQVVNDLDVFEVATPLYWVDCPENVVAYSFMYINGEFSPYYAPEPIIIIPTTVSMRQARLALLQQNLLDTVETAIAGGTRADQITWEYATDVNRSDTLVQNLSVSLGLTESDLDNLFTLAGSL